MQIKNLSVITTSRIPIEEFLQPFLEINLRKIEILIITNDLEVLKSILHFKSKNTNQKIIVSPVYCHYNIPQIITLKMSILSIYKWILIWDLPESPNPKDIDSLINLGSANHICGIQGGCFYNQLLSSTNIIQSTTLPQSVEFLMRDCIFLEKTLISKIIGSVNINAGFGTELDIATLIKTSGGELILAPTVAAYQKKQLEWSSSDIREFTYKVINSNFTPKKWDEINSKVLPNLLPGTHFEILHEKHNFHIAVFGCQRSGTTWINSLLGKYFSNVISLNENQTFDYLLDNLILSDDYYRKTISMQTTFIVSERESFVLAPKILLNLFVLRNPLSVCWSLTYHFNALESVYAYRKSKFSYYIKNIFSNPLTNLEKSICLYLDSLETAQTLLDNNLIIVSYENFVIYFMKSIAKLQRAFCELSGEVFSQAINNYQSIDDIDQEPLTKYKQLTLKEKMLIEKYCKEPYLKLMMASINE